MEPEHLRFGGGVADTAIHPLVALLLLLTIALIIALPRSKVIVAFLMAFYLVPAGQVVVLAGMHFTGLRILILAVLARVILSKKATSGERFPGGFNPVDQVAVLWAVSAMIVISVQWMQTQAFINAMGDLIETLGAYVAVRYLVPDGETVQRTIKTLAAICVIQGICMVNEQISHINVFGLLGGIDAGVTVRDGKIRSAGVMGCLYAGAFAGVLVPLFLWLWTEGKAKLLACAGIIAAVAMVITSNASTSIMALGGSLLGLAFWPLRKQMRLVRWGLVAMLVSLHMVMKAPVWALIARIDLTGSSSGEQRAALLDHCIRHFWDWWLIGTKYYNEWGWGMWDLCNQFVAVALTGGLLTLVLYIAIFKRSFAALGNTRKLSDGARGEEWILWCLGCALFATVVASFGINYVTQLMTGFFALLACISVTTIKAREAAAQPAQVQGHGVFAATGALTPLRVSNAKGASGLFRGNDTAIGGMTAAPAAAKGTIPVSLKEK